MQLNEILLLKIKKPSDGQMKTERELCNTITSAEKSVGRGPKLWRMDGLAFGGNY